MVIQKPERLLTVEDFWEEYAGQPVELLHGKVIKLSPVGGEAPRTGAVMTAFVTIFVLQNNLGIVTNAESGYWITKDTLCAPDVGFYGWEKAKQHADRDSYRPFPPDLAIEIVSPTDRASAIDEKVADYLRAGVLLVWVVYPKTRTVMRFQSNAQPQRLTVADTLDGGDVLPGFTLPVAECFPTEPATADDE